MELASSDVVMIFYEQFSVISVSDDFFTAKLSVCAYVFNVKFPLHRTLHWNIEIIAATVYWSVIKSDNLITLTYFFPPVGNEIEVAYFTVTWSGLMIGFQSCLIAIPINLIIAYLFRQARPPAKTLKVFNRGNKRL